MKTIDALGLACPIPVIMATKEIENGEKVFDILVDNDIAVENLSKTAKANGFDLKVSGEEPKFTLRFTKKEQSGQTPAQPPKQTTQPTLAVDKGYMIFMGSDIIGAGNRELGTNLARMFFFTLAEETNLPKTIAFMNGGVKLATQDEQVVESLKKLKDKGVKILVCGTCLDFYGIADQVKIGEVSNMYEIQQEIINASNSIIL